MSSGFVVWFTGRPASGKTTVADRTRAALRARGVPVLWLDSDDLRSVLTPTPSYSEDEREHFYAALRHLAARAVEGGVAVVISATGMRRRWRDALRQQVARFCEVELEVSREAAARRDPKGLYAAVREGHIEGLPGVDAPFERSERAELCLDAEHRTPAELTDAVLRWLDARDWIEVSADSNDD